MHYANKMRDVYLLGKGKHFLYKFQAKCQQRTKKLAGWFKEEIRSFFKEKNNVKWRQSIFCTYKISVLCSNAYCNCSSSHMFSLLYSASGLPLFHFNNILLCLNKCLYCVGCSISRVSLSFLLNTVVIACAVYYLQICSYPGIPERMREQFDDDFSKRQHVVFLIWFNNLDNHLRISFDNFSMSIWDRTQLFDTNLRSLTILIRNI